MPEEAHLYQNLSGWEYLQLIGRLRGMPRDLFEPRIDEFLRALLAVERSPRSAFPFPKACARRSCSPPPCSTTPTSLILDEPFSGLDVTSALIVRSLLRRLAGQGKMILFSSHVLEVVEKVCTNVLILRKGEVVAYDSIARLRGLMSQPSLEGVFAQLSEGAGHRALALADH